MVIQEEQRHSSTYSCSLHWVDTSDQLRISAVLATSKESQYILDRMFSGPQSSSGYSGVEKNLFSYRDSKSGPPSSSPSRHMEWKPLCVMLYQHKYWSFNCEEMAREVYFTGNLNNGFICIKYVFP